MRVFNSFQELMAGATVGGQSQSTMRTNNVQTPTFTSQTYDRNDAVWQSSWITGDDGEEFVYDVLPEDGAFALYVKFKNGTRGLVQKEYEFAQDAIRDAKTRMDLKDPNEGYLRQDTTGYPWLG